MDELRQLLRYEIPGLITIIYSLMLSWQTIMELLSEYEIYLKQISKVLPSLVGATVVLALPFGCLVYTFYTALEDECFLRNRKGMVIVEKILEKYPNCTEKEKKWWKDKCWETKNETLDMIFYKHKRKFGKILERFINFYHSGRVIGIYVPLSALILHSILVLCVCMNLGSLLWDIIKNTLMISIITIGLLIVYFISRDIKPKNMKLKNIESNKELKNMNLSPRWFFYLGTAILYIVVIIFLYYSKNPIFILYFLILAISLITIPRTLEDGQLKIRINELETNMLLPRKQEIVETIRERIEFEGSLSCKPPKAKHISHFIFE